MWWLWVLGGAVAIPALGLLGVYVCLRGLTAAAATKVTEDIDGKRGN